MYCLPGGLSTLVRHSIMETLNEKTALTQIGSRLVLPALNFIQLDDDKTCTITPEDILQTYAVAWPPQPSP